VFEGLQQ
jgi:hypothetical protein